MIESSSVQPVGTLSGVANNYHEATLGTRQLPGLRWSRLFSLKDAYSTVEWEKRTAKIIHSDGTIVFEQSNIEVPKFWSQTASDIVASKYFRGKLGTASREWSVKQLVDRVANTIAYWGWKDGYFQGEDDYNNFREDLKYLLVQQYAAFNSPVWFNVGFKENPQASACFILSVEDNMESILQWYHDEAMIFRGGSGSGINLSNLRSSRELLSTGGRSSGPVSFMKGADGIANTIRSGGATRRAAKMVVLNVDHPDIKDFIFSKQIIENMTKVLSRAGIKDSISAELFDPYTLLPYQNANNSVRVTDEFMQAVKEDGSWQLKAVASGEVLGTLPARQIMRWCAEAVWASADPGMQYHTTINDWHTLPNTGPISASNPCAEYMSIDDSACNLASINLLKYLQDDGTFDVAKFRKTVRTMIVAQDIIVQNSSYPTEKISQNAKHYRQLGLGYANLGALLMAEGVPYDSDQGRALAGAITALMSGEAYRTSAVLAKKMAPFAGYELNKHPMLRVIQKHAHAADELVQTIKQHSLLLDDGLINASQKVWHDALQFATAHGVRNSQVSVLAPTGTISFMMDCDTTGIEPELALVKYKKLVGGGSFKMVNRQVPRVLRKLGFQEEQISAINDYILDQGTIEGAPDLKLEHLPVFDCSFKAQNGTRTISYQGHLKMMAAAQPFISGAISKTVNLPQEATVEQLEQAFMEAWHLGLKAVAFYRDGSKTLQPLSTRKDDPLVEHVNGYTRIKMPDERPAVTHKFSVGGYEGYVTAGFYPDSKKLGETFLVAAKEGSTVSGLLDTVATLISMCLQSGIPLKTLVRKFTNVRFEPSGFTNNPDIPVAKSIIDYIFRYLGMKFLTEAEKEEVFGPNHIATSSASVSDSLNEQMLKKESNPGEEISEIKNPGANGNAADSVSAQLAFQKEVYADAPICECGSLMLRAGSCWTCPNCFATSGVCN